MISAWTVYWILQLDSVCAFMFILGLIVVGFGLFLIINFGEENEITDENRSGFNFLLIGVAILVFAMFIPNTKQMAMIYVIPKIANSDFAKTMPAKLQQLANKEIDKLLKDD